MVLVRIEREEIIAIYTFTTVLSLATNDVNTNNNITAFAFVHIWNGFISGSFVLGTSIAILSFLN